MLDDVGTTRIMGLTVRVPHEDDSRSPVFKKGAPRVISSVALVRWLLVGAVFVLSIVYFNGSLPLTTIQPSVSLSRTSRRTR